MMPCRALGYDTGFLHGMLDFADCQARTIGAEGYAALATPGSAFSLVMSGLLTLFIAMFGYRMLLGHVPDLREGVLALAKVAIVLALATSWPAYRILVYDLAIRGPGEIAAGITGPTGLRGGGAAMVDRLQRVDVALLALSRAGVGGGAPQPSEQPEAIHQEDQTFDPWALNGARALFLTAAIGAFASVRLVAGLMLALGPLFIAFLLFAATRGLFEGWLRALAAAALGAMGITVITGVHLVLIEPWLGELLARRASGLAITGAPVELLVAMAVYAILLVSVLAATSRVALGFRIPGSWLAMPERVLARFQEERRAGVPPLADRAPVMDGERSRAIAVAEAVASVQRREEHRVGRPVPNGRELSSAAAAPAIVGESRRTRPRGSARAARRDLQA